MSSPKRTLAYPPSSEFAKVESMRQKALGFIKFGEITIFYQ